MMVRCILYVFLLLSIISSPGVYASEFNIECDDELCSPQTIKQFFDPKKQWYPGVTESHTIILKNKSSEIYYIGIQAYQFSSSSSQRDIAEALRLTIRRASDSSQLWVGSLKKFYSAGGIVLDRLKKNAIQEYNFHIEMLDVGNEYQGGKTQFSMFLGFADVTPTPTPTITPTPTTTPTPTLAPTSHPSITATPTIPKKEDIKDNEGKDSIKKSENNNKTIERERPISIEKSDEINSDINADLQPKKLDLIGSRFETRNNSKNVLGVTTKGSKKGKESILIAIYFIFNYLLVFIVNKRSNFGLNLSIRIITFALVSFAIYSRLASPYNLLLLFTFLAGLFELIIRREMLK